MSDEIGDARCFACDIELIDVQDIRFGVCSDCLENAETIKEIFEQAEMYTAMTFNIFQALKEKATLFVEPDEVDYN